MAIQERYLAKRDRNGNIMRDSNGKQIDDLRQRRYLVRIATTDPVSGKRRNITVGTFGTKDEAAKAERKAFMERDGGNLIDPDGMTMRDLLALWLRTKRGSISDNAYAEYEIAIEKHILPVLGNAKVQRLTPVAVQDVYDAWKEEHAAFELELAEWEASRLTAKPTRRGLSARYIQRVHLIIGQALDHAVRLRVTPVNVARETTRPTVRRRRIEVWNGDQLRRFLEAAELDGYAPLWHLLGLEGMRRGEALGLRWQDVDFQRGTAHLVQSVIADQTAKGAAKIQHRTKTAAGARTVRLTPETLALLRKRHDRRAFGRKAAGDSRTDHDLIVTTSNGTPVNPTTVRRSFDRLCKEAGVPRLTVHSLRHTAATLLLQAGVPVKVVSERLGHASATVTLDVYGHLLPDAQDMAVSTMSAIMASGEKTG